MRSQWRLLERLLAPPAPLRQPSHQREWADAIPQVWGTRDASPLRLEVRVVARDAAPGAGTIATLRFTPLAARVLAADLVRMADYLEGEDATLPPGMTRVEEPAASPGAPA